MLMYARQVCGGAHISLEFSSFREKAAEKVNPSGNLVVGLSFRGSQCFLMGLEVTAPGRN